MLVFVAAIMFFRLSARISALEGEGAMQ